MEALRSVGSRTGAHLSQVLSARSEIRVIHAQDAANDVELLAQIGYKQELNRHYSTIQVFGIAFSIMGLLPSVASVMALGLESGASGLVWGWFIAGFFIMCTGTSLTILGSAIPTSGGLYYYTNYYAPPGVGVPLSFVIGCSNSVGLCGGICSIAYGFATEVLSAVYISRDGDFEITNAKSYGVFAACIISNVLICCLTTKHTATLQSVSIVVNVFLIILFIIAVPIGASHNGFNDAKYIFGPLENYRTWNQGWSFVLSWMPAIWTIGSFDAVIHCSEEAKNAQRAIPYGILGSIGACWILGWILCIVSAATIKGGVTLAILDSNTGNPMAQIIYDALGKKWAVAFMAMISVGQYLMSLSIVTAASRQIWAFARDDGLPFHNFVKFVNPVFKVPIRATMFAGVFSLLVGLLVLINGSAGSGALFSLAVASNMLAWGVPTLLVLLPTGRKRFQPGPFYLGKYVTTAVHITTVCWIGFIITMSMFPDSKSVNKNSMNYTCVINVGVWLLALIYYFVYGHKYYSGPKSNLEDVYDGENPSFEIDAMLDEKNNFVKI
ncbi:amino acid transporter [Suhomyces tanzawaensis NRRL Y-17324]|uniref:Amino acid transporter n=1 Tax=Suhomyces tanzawaensis NRRL Y-17324 TaxID=984487 RepID=A0A1E4SKT7_9ASCO|nr:amino acid transporter [Suhomyces tanzawaensis NRRL Y-17324]ODV80042.1 amino acid transporter [Suhomyces tanzawaensis NRRL Y-17324]